MVHIVARALKQPRTNDVRYYFQHQPQIFVLMIYNYQYLYKERILDVFLYLSLKLKHIKLIQNYVQASLGMVMVQPCTYTTDKLMLAKVHTHL